METILFSGPSQGLRATGWVWALWGCYLPCKVKSDRQDIPLQATGRVVREKVQGFTAEGLLAQTKSDWGCKATFLWAAWNKRHQNHCFIPRLAQSHSHILIIRTPRGRRFQPLVECVAPAFSIYRRPQATEHTAVNLHDYWRTVKQSALQPRPQASLAGGQEAVTSWITGKL